MKIVINRCFGGFGLSDEAILAYSELAGLNLKRVEKGGPFGNYFYKNGIETNENFFSDYDIDRADVNLVAVVEKLGEAANGFAADLKVVEIPDGVEWQIEEYDGSEHIAEKHRTWR